MSAIEKGEIGNPARNLEHLNILKPSLDTIRELRSKHLIGDHSPYWWSTDYAPDPREYLSFAEFKRRLVHLGKGSFRSGLGINRDAVREREIYLYPNPAVPMTIVSLPIENQKLPFLVTARPYHEKETFSGRFALQVVPVQGIDKIKESLSKGERLNLLNHFLPHIRGLFAGARGNHLFWYPIDPFSTEFYEEFKRALQKTGKSFLDLYSQPYRTDRTYPEVWEELKEKRNLVDMRKPAWVDFPYLEVSAEEFIRDYNNNSQNLLLFYPLRVSNIEQTLPLLISNITHKGSKIRKSVVLGIYAENGGHGYTRKGGILRIKDLELTKTISSKISMDFGIPVDVVLFTPQKGRPKYDRISTLQK